MKRVLILVIDSLGIGAMPDASEYNDLSECNTLVNVAKFNKGLNLPNLEKLGLGNITEIQGVKPVENPSASFGKMAEVSKGKDTTTGHWEIAGLILDNPFRTYPQGFPPELIERFIKETGCKQILANYPASGTAVIEQLGDEHVKTGFPIVYTSADSVFQIACHVDTVSLETLYKWCEIARNILDDGYNVSRVIARPFNGTSGAYKRISAARKDYSVAPPKATVLNNLVDNKGSVIGIGKIEDIFVQSGITHAVHTGSNKEGLELTLKALKNELNLKEIAIKDEFADIKNDKSIIFVNLVDTDMLYGHRNDALGYGKALEEIDENLSQIIDLIKEDDLLIITGDHGCDPTMPGTDHTREYVPVLVYNPSKAGKNLETRKSFSDVASTVSDWLNLSYNSPGTSML